MQRADSLEKTLMLGKIEGKKEKRVAEDETVRERHRLNRDESVSMGSQRVRHNLAAERWLLVAIRDITPPVAVRDP